MNPEATQSVLPTVSDPSQPNNPKFDESGKNIRRAIRNAAQALDIARKLEDDDRQRDFDRARALAAFNGNAPYDENELVGAGQSYRFNLSFGLMEGVIGRALAPYLELVSDSQYLANIDGNLSREKLDIMRDEFSEVVKRWGRFPKLYTRLAQDLILNGWNNVVFPSDYDPWPLFIEQKYGYVPDMTPNDVSDLEIFVWRREYLIHELYNNVADPVAAKNIGWNVENCRYAIENAVPRDILLDAGIRGGGWVDVEQAIRSGTLYSSVCGGKIIYTYHVFACEIDGRVSHYIVLDKRGSAHEDSVNVEKGGRDIELFKRLDRWESMEDILVYFDLEPGDGKWHGSRGLGRRAFNSHQSQDKLRCGLLDQSFTSGLTLLQAKDQESQDNFNLAVVGPFAVIPAGLDVSSTTVPAIPTTAFQVDALLSTTLEQRVGDVVPSISTPTRRGNQTATAANIANNRSLMINKSNLVRFMEPLSKMLSIIVRRLLLPNSPNKFSKMFQKALIERGFDEEDFRKVRGAKSTGRVEAVMGQDRANYTELLGVYRGDPDVNQKDLKSRHMAAVVGPKDIGGLLIPDDDQTIQIEAVRAQMEEIAGNLNGMPMPISPRDNHEIHAATSIKWLMSELQKHQQLKGTTNIQALDMAGKHAGQHVQMLKSDRSKKQIASQLEEQLKQIAGELDQMQQTAQQIVQTGAV